MKFESKFGIGEIVHWSKENPRLQEKFLRDEFLEVNAIVFGRTSDGRIDYIYQCRHTDGRVSSLAEFELDGDPTFDQETGRYPDEL